MPWSPVSPMDQRMQFVAECLEHQFSVRELCERYGISRKTGNKWLSRYRAEGPKGLANRSKAPHSCRHRTPDEIQDALLELRRRHPSWGAKKLLAILRRRRPDWPLPARSTCCDILARNGLVRQKRQRRKPGHPGPPTTPITRPNEVWTADFKGEFKTRDGIYCYPLTIVDGYSRYLLGCQALPSTATLGARPVFQRLFDSYGLPDRIRTDNGAPFAAVSLGRLSRLSVWWLRLGIFPELIEPGKPSQNGRHERLHRTLKQETLGPAAGNRNAQQRRFNRFTAEYNHQRPHEALDQETPAAYYEPSSRSSPESVPGFDYPDHFEIRRVGSNGGIRWRSLYIPVSTVCEGDDIGLEAIDDGLWDVYMGPLKLGRLNENNMRIEDANGRLRRK